MLNTGGTYMTFFEEVVGIRVVDWGDLGVDEVRIRKRDK